MAYEFGDKDVISVVISYSSRSHLKEFDRLVRELLDRRKISRSSYKIEIFTDQELNAGERFVEDIPAFFNEADIIICLVTKEFFEVDFINDYEKDIIKGKAKQYKGIATVIPIIVSHKGYDYKSTWLGKIGLVTYPLRYKSIVSNRFRNEGWLEVEKTLDSTFRKFQKGIVEKRIAGESLPPREFSVTAKNLKLLLGGGALVLLSVLLTLFFTDQLPPPAGPNGGGSVVVPPPAGPNGGGSVVVPPPAGPNGGGSVVVSPPAGPNRGGPVVVPPPVGPNGGGSVAVPPPVGPNGGGKTKRNRLFPRNMSDYPYFGKQPYYEYESCQGINENGYKPCKKNRRWYIVNERRGKHLKLKVDARTHKDIFAIRPFLDNTAEVYYHDGKGMYLSFCITLDNASMICE